MHDIVGGHCEMYSKVFHLSCVVHCEFDPCCGRTYTRVLLLCSASITCECELITSGFLHVVYLTLKEQKHW